MSQSKRQGTADEAFVDSLAKVELHVHLEGSMGPEILLELRHRHGIDDLPETEEGLRAWYRFRDFDHFIDVYLSSVRALRDGADFALLASSTAEHLAAQGVRHAEITFTPWLHLRRGLPLEEVFAGLEEGRLAAQSRTGISIQWIADTPGDMGLAAAEGTLEALSNLPAPALSRDGGAVGGFGLGGPEVPRAPFAGVFEAARAVGLQSVPHAGEVAGAESIWAALDQLGAKRIGHGIAAVHDPALLRRLRSEQIVLEVCPTSNVRTGVVESLSVHPLKRLLDAGVPVTINSDDPPMFDTTLRDEFLLALGPLGLTRQQVVSCARTAVSASFLADRAKAALLRHPSLAPMSPIGPAAGAGWIML